MSIREFYILAVFYGRHLAQLAQVEWFSLYVSIVGFHGGCKTILQVSKPNVSAHRVLNYFCGLQGGVSTRSSHAPAAVVL